MVGTLGEHSALCAGGSTGTLRMSVMPSEEAGGVWVPGAVILFLNILQLQSTFSIIAC